MTEKDNIIEQDIADIIMERPYGFEIDERQFCLYQPTLGKTYLLARLMDELNLDKDKASDNPFAEALRVCEEQRDNVCRLMAYHTCNKRSELFDNDFMAKRAEFFAKNLDSEELAKLFVITLTFGNVTAVIKHLGIDKERERLARVSEIKRKKSNTITFGGCGVFGSLIQPACEKLNMTPEQVVWGISYPLLSLIMADIPNSIYLTDEEMKQARIYNVNATLDGDDPRTWAKLRALRMIE